jgi:phosphoglycerol transferase MdoB-like AlkP superfamily enzyme
MHKIIVGMNSKRNSFLMRCTLLLPGFVAVLVFRYLFNTGWSPVGMIDDLAFSLALAAAIAIAQSHGIIIAALMLSVILVLLLGLYSNGINYQFFGSFLTPDAIAMLSLADDASDSVSNLIEWKGLVGVLVLPYLIAGRLCFVKSMQINLGRRYQRFSLLILSFLFVACSGSAWALKDIEFVAAQVNPVNQLKRQMINRWYQRSFLDVDEMMERFYRRRDLLVSRSSVSKFKQNKSYPLVAEQIEGLTRSPSIQAKNAAIKPNIVLVVLESLRAHEHSTAPFAERVAPNLSRLRQTGIWVPNLYFNGSQTARGEFATLCSYHPYFEGGQEYSLFPDLSIRCLPELLRDGGYETLWFLGYDYTYANHHGFLSTHGFQKLFGQQHMSEAGYGEQKISWGISDEASFKFAVQTLSTTRQPFFAEILTLSNHHPFDQDFGIPDPDIPGTEHESKHYRDFLRGVHYSDYAVGRLIEEATKTTWFDNTIFVFVGDHGVRVFPQELHGRALSQAEMTEMYFRSGMIVWSPTLIEAKQIDDVASQIDIAPSLLRLANVGGVHSFQGISIFDAPASGSRPRYALMLTENGWNLRQENDYCYALGQSCFEKTFPECEVGQKPQFLGHSCFSSQMDLLGVHEPQIQSVKSEHKDAMIYRGRTLVEFNNFLMENNRIFPVSAP